MAKAKEKGRRREPTRAVDRAALTAAGVLVLMVLAPARPGAAREGQGGPGSTVRQVWLDARGHPLPFQGTAEIEEFLRSARVVSREEIGVGINRMDKLLVEKDGVQAHAIFRDVDEEEEGVRLGGRLYRRFKDSYTGECAAYAVAQLFGVDNVPPTVPRALRGRDGCMQIWVEKTRDQDAADFAPPEPLAWVKQTWGMSAFDNLIFNVDRNAGNMLAGEDYHLWLIDHTRAFQPESQLLSPDSVKRISRRAWGLLHEITGEELAEATRRFLDPGQVMALAKRRELLIERIQSLVDEHGEDAVLY
jgi:hypothetical protein